MGSKYPVLRPQEIIRILELFGFSYKSQKGSHVKYIKTEKDKPTKIVIIPMHNEIAKGAVKSILHQAGLTIEEFLSKK
ncbi:MAG: type II toxin-antitoxin system HicA family toxin [Oscillospiraceae bacterium]|jgi:predicted RNA binding protein YcfA (HicA-like mRNA interferase family)|nr:type II toxin-antitoxin system HicA family toxin [Oscillospiraceae bacterium]